jgi:hypothetical protein
MPETMLAATQTDTVVINQRLRKDNMSYAAFRKGSIPDFDPNSSRFWFE